MGQGNPTKDQTTLLILGTVRSEKQDFFSKLNSFSLLMVKGKDGEPLFVGQNEEAKTVLYYRNIDALYSSAYMHFVRPA